MDLTRLVEIGEAEAFLDQFRAAPAPLAQMLGLETFHVGGATGLMARNVDEAVFNRTLGLGLTEPARPEHLDEISARYRPLGLTTPRFQLSPGAEPQADIRRWLAERGMGEAPDAWTKRARLTADLPQVTTDLVVVEASNMAGDFARVACAGFGMPLPMALWLQALVGRPNWRTFVALDGERPVASGALYLGEDYGWLGVGATLPEARGRGGQGALMRTRLEAAARAGKAWAITETGAPAPGKAPGASNRNMDRHGFVEVHVRPSFYFG